MAARLRIIVLLDMFVFLFLLSITSLKLAVGRADDRGEVVTTAGGRIRALRQRNDADFVLGGLFSVQTMKLPVASD